jgi:hypothetical protein
MVVVVAVITARSVIILAYMKEGRKEGRKEGGKVGR